MKRLALICSVLLFHSMMAQQTISIGGAGSDNAVPTVKGIAAGQIVPEIKFINLLNTEKRNISLSELKNKIVILEFWATWCGPCLPAMDHLNDLKKKFADKLEVIAISDETEERIQRYIKNKLSALLFSVDPKQSLQQFFPFHAVPHSVVIDQNGKLVANTSPGEITESIIAEILNGKNVSLKEKKDLSGSFDMTKDYFPRPADFNDYAFDLQPPIPGGFPITRNFPTRSTWYGRRISMINNPISLIYQNTFGKTTATTIFEGVDVSEFDYRRTKYLFCIDVIVPKGKESELYSFLQQKLLKSDLPYKSRIEKRKMETVVITSANPAMLEPYRSAAGDDDIPKGQTIVRATSYTGKNKPLNDLTSHFEKYGIFKQPVINETGITGNFDLTFEFDAENPKSFKEELAKLGLKAEKKEREVEVLVIYKANL